MLKSNSIFDILVPEGYVVVMTEDEKRLFLLVICLVICLVGGGVFGSCIWASTYENHAWKTFDADRACRPGMMVDRISDDRVVCVGGEGENWIVELDK